MSLRLARKFARRWRWSAMLLATLLIAACATGRRHAVDPGYVASLEAFALLQSFNAELLSHDSATATLERWCAQHRLATPAQVVANRVRGAAQAPTAEQRVLLGVDTNEPVRHRRVRLTCGEVVMSEADNWYVPSRLTPAMNAELESSDSPFGRVTQPLQFRRRTLASELLWRPLAEDWWNSRAVTEGCRAPPAQVLRHQALLTLPDGRPISLVIETYGRDALPRRN